MLGRGSFRVHPYRDLGLGVDFTVFKLTKASLCYTTVLKRDKGKTVKRIKKHLKVVLIVEVRKQLIVAQKLRCRPANDVKDFIPLVVKACKVGSIKWAIGDKDTAQKRTTW